MAKKIVGYRHVDFSDDKGNKIIGDKIYFSDDSNPYITGVATDSVWIPDGKLPFKLDLNQEIDIRYNKYGKFESISLVKGGKF